MILFYTQFEIVFLERSHSVLSMIFGIFGKFGIEIGTRKKLVEKNFVEKIRKLLVEKKNWDQKF